jgi:3-oxoacyl-[acyl-carrier protein] reductase
MDLGLKGRKAIVCASSRGLGRACALALAREGADVVVNGRDAERVHACARAIADETGVAVSEVVADLDDEAGRRNLLAACPEPDILINNNGGPPPGGFRDWGPAEWQAGLTANLLVAVELIKATVDGMVARGFGRIVNITSIAVKMPFPGLAMSSTARAGLTAFTASVAREVAAHNVTVNNLQPGFFDTDRLRAGQDAVSRISGRALDEVRADQLARIPAARFGDADELGRACAYLCSAHAGYLTGQNLLIDGGCFPGAF